MQFTVFVAALAVCTGIFASPASANVQAQQSGQAQQATQAGQTSQTFRRFRGYGYPVYSYPVYTYPVYYGGYYGW